MQHDQREAVSGPHQPSTIIPCEHATLVARVVADLEARVLAIEERIKVDARRLEGLAIEARIAEESNRARLNERLRIAGRLLELAEARTTSDGFDVASRIMWTIGTKIREDCL